ncbi:glycosyltransferase [Patescibacteria group bacterium]|nr:glycosyltransferase [Patescibacteria group bacterium]
MISIIIPAYNEEECIGGILQSIADQDIEEAVEVVVADANSRDKTIEVAEKYRNRLPLLTVVKGGWAPVGRNNGARASSGDPIFFIDADITLPRRDFLRTGTEMFRKKNLAVATTYLWPNSNNWLDYVLVGLYDAVLLSAKYIRPLGAMCIVASRNAFIKSGGYPENEVMAEDHDFVWQCRKFGRYDVLSLAALTSVRRMEKEGRLVLVYKYLKATAYRLLFGPITHPIFKYEFGSYSGEKETKEKVKETDQPRVTLYCELYRFTGNIFYRGIGTGFITSYENQMRALKAQGIFFTQDLRTQTDIFQANSHGPRTLWLIKKFRKRGEKTILYAHATAEDLRISFRILRFFVPLLRKYLSYLYHQVDMIVCPSTHTADLLIQKYGIPRIKTVVISNGVEAGKFFCDKEKRKKLRKEQNIAHHHLLIINVAMAIKRKGVDTFIAMSKIFTDIRFIWFGKIFSRTVASGIPPHPANVLFYGYVPDITVAYSSADIFLFPSYEEQQGISVLEAGSAGLPVVVRDIPAYEGWLEDGVHCFKAKNDEEFEEKLRRLIQDESLRQKMGTTLRAMIMRNHTIEAVGRQLADLYAALGTDTEHVLKRKTIKK